MHFLDLGCGTGAVTREIAATGILPAGLTGVDLTADMLDVARNRAQEVGFDVNWVEADAVSLPFSDDRFSLAYCQQALQFFPDPLLALTDF